MIEKPAGVKHEHNQEHVGCKCHATRYSNSCKVDGIIASQVPVPVLVDADARSQERKARQLKAWPHNNGSTCIANVSPRQSPTRRCCILARINLHGQDRISDCNSLAKRRLNMGLLVGYVSLPGCLAEVRLFGAVLHACLPASR